MYYREKKWKQRKKKNVKVKESLELLDIRIFPVSKSEKNKSRKSKKKETAPKQKSLNNKRSREYHVRLIHCNFDQSDYVIHTTFSNNERPIAKEEVEREFRNYILRINRRRKKEGLGNAKYIAVIEGGDGTKKKVHFHIIIDGQLNRDILEDLWGKGYVNVDRLQLNEEGLNGLTKYMCKEKNLDKEEERKWDKSWRSSMNLDKPKIEVNDNRFSKRKVKNMIFEQPSREELEKMYPGYTLTYYESKYNQEYGHIYIDIKMRRFVNNDEKKKDKKRYKKTGKG